ncbi:hypothetical protein D3C87_2056030 [compost metagenome]
MIRQGLHILGVRQISQGGDSGGDAVAVLAVNLRQLLHRLLVPVDLEHPALRLV